MDPQGQDLIFDGQAKDITGRPLRGTDSTHDSNWPFVRFIDNTQASTPPYLKGGVRGSL